MHIQLKTTAMRSNEARGREQKVDAQDGIGDLKFIQLRAPWTRRHSQKIGRDHRGTET